MKQQGLQDVAAFCLFFFRFLGASASRVTTVECTLET